MFGRSVVCEIATQCAYYPHDGTTKIAINDVFYDVYLRTLPKCFEILKRSSTEILLKSRQIAKGQKEEGIKDVDLAEVILRICQQFGINFVRVDENAASLLVHDSERQIPQFSRTICLIHVTIQGIFRVIQFNNIGKLNTLNELALFAHSNFHSHSPLFNLLVAQLVDIFKQFAINGVFLLFSTHRISADENLWLQLNFDEIFHPLSFNIYDKNQENNDESSQLWVYTQRWCKWELSNLDYLLKLNEFAGRSRDDPVRPAVVPWVTDFTSDTDNSLSPLDRLKYRLSKGDAQLNEQYHNQIPAYHIPELLSDICCLVYRARVTSKNILCQHVRSVWVPEEYPVSMARLYAWTPDECIPDFYDNPSIFTSIHSDLTDLEIPSWTTSPQNFVKWHRNILESDKVSERIHKWIDLAFGYLLSGNEAIEALNVHLSYVDNQLDSSIKTERLRRHGTVKLFTRPHPRRLPRNSIMDTDSLKKCDESFLAIDRKIPNNSSSTTRSASASLPDESVLLMNALENIYDTYGENSAYARESLISVGVTIVELALAEYCRDLLAHATFADRLKRAQNLICDKSYFLPRNLRHSLKLLLRVDCFSRILPRNKDNDLNRSLNEFFTITYNVTIIQPLLIRYFYVEQELRIAIASNNEYNINQLTRETIAILSKCFIFTEFHDLWLEMFINSIEISEQTAATICFCLLNDVVQLAGDQHATMRLVNVIHSLLDSPSKYNLKLFDRRFVLQLCIYFGSPMFFKAFLPHIIEALIFNTNNERDELSETIYKCAKETILWLSKRYGAFVTVTQISNRLLLLLSVCYSNKSIHKIDEMSLDAHVKGDEYCNQIVNVLIELSTIYGTAIISLQYIPFCADVIAQAMRRLCTSTGTSTTIESASIAVIVALNAFCDALSDKQMMDHLQESIIEGVVFPAVRLFSSPTAIFSSTNTRRLFAAKTICILHLIALRVGTENVRRYLAAAVQRVFCTFNLIYDYEQEENDVNGTKLKLAQTAPKQLLETFTTDFAHLLVNVFSFICGRQYLRDVLPNAPLIFELAASKENADVVKNTFDTIAKPKFPLKTQYDSLELSSSASILNGECMATFNISDIDKLSKSMTNSQICGKTISPIHNNDILPATYFDPNANFPPPNQKISEKSISQLSGNWVDHLRGVLSSTNSTMNFNYIPLATFRGHSDAIRKLHVLDNENSFISASTDCALNLWSIQSTDDPNFIIPPQWTYSQHIKPVQDFTLLKSSSHIASVDTGSIHIWDPFRGTIVYKINCDSIARNSVQIPSIISLEYLGSHLLAIASENDSIIRTLDGRYGKWCHELYAWPLKSTSIYTRMISASPDYARKLAVALSNGHTIIIDVRTGKVLASFVSAHSRVTQMEWLSADVLVSAHAEQSVEIWTISNAISQNSSSARNINGISLTRRLSEIASTIAVCSNTSKFSPYKFHDCKFITRNASRNIFSPINSLGTSASTSSLQRSSSGKKPKPGSVAINLGDNFPPFSYDENDSLPLITLTQSASLNRLRLYHNAINNDPTETRLRANFTHGGVTALAYLKMNQMILFGCADGIIRLAC